MSAFATCARGRRSDFLRWIRPGNIMADIGPFQIQQWQLHLQSIGASPATQRRKLSTPSTLFRALCSEAWLAPILWCSCAGRASKVLRE